MIDDQPKEFSDYIGVLRRRRRQIVWTVAVVFLISVIVVVALPPQYRSTATILIEEQEIPPDLVRSTVTSYAAQRIHVINQRVMTRDNLWQIIERFDLYPKDRQVKTRDEILEQMREDVGLDIQSAEVIDPRSGRSTEATIAFVLSFDGDTPGQAQQVTNELVSLYLTENVRTRTRKAEDTSDFLAEEAETLNKKVLELEESLASFKAANVDRLPELQQLNLQLMDRTESELKEMKARFRSLQERQFYLQGQLAQIDPHTQMVTAGGERVLTPQERLKLLETQFVSLNATYGPEHPDVVKMRREIEALRAEVGGVADIEAQAKELAKLRADLAAAKEQYSDDHPDVVRLQRSIAALEKTIAETESKTPEAVADIKPENPAYITLKAQLEAVSADMQGTEQAIKDLSAKLSGLEKRLMETPQVERQYTALTREHENTLKRYAEVRAKLMEAQVGAEMEKESKGERFTLIDGPTLPEQPDKPNRVAILFLGMVFSVAGGLGSAAVAESLDQSIRNPRSLMSLTGTPPLAVIPYFETPLEARRRVRLRIATAVTLIAALVIALTLMHLFWKPLDVLWYATLRHLTVTLGW